MKRRLSRTKLAKICAAYDSGAFNSQNRTPVGILSADVVYVYASGQTIPEDSPVKITGFRNVSTYETVKRLWRAGRLVLTGEVATTSAGTHAYALTRINEGKVGLARLTDGCFKDLSFADGQIPSRVDQPVQGGSIPGFNVVASSALDPSTYHAVCFLSPYRPSKLTQNRADAITGITFSVESGVLRINVATTANKFVTGVGLS